MFDPGPLEYWLLAIPVHISPDHGVLWGADHLLHGRLLAGRRGGLGRPAVQLAGLAASALTIGMVAVDAGDRGAAELEPLVRAIFFLAALAAAWAVLCRAPGLVAGAGRHRLHRQPRPI